MREIPLSTYKYILSKEPRFYGRYYFVCLKTEKNLLRNQGDAMLEKNLLRNQGDAMFLDFRSYWPKLEKKNLYQ